MLTGFNKDWKEYLDWLDSHDSFTSEEEDENDQRWLALCEKYGNEEMDTAMEEDIARMYAKSRNVRIEDLEFGVGTVRKSKKSRK